MAQYYNSYQPTVTSSSSDNAFYTPASGSSSASNQFYSSNLGGAIGSSSSALPASSSYGGGVSGVMSGQVVGWWNAFGTGGMEGEPPLLEELGINFDHILAKSLAVLNPLAIVDVHIMDDADLAGPLVFCFVFAMLLLISGKPQFSYIYGVALFGSGSLYCLLNLMSESGIDAYRTASVLGYCLLPLVILSVFSIVISLDSMLGYLLSLLSVIWCSYSASSIFASVLHLHSQRMLVAYPISLLYSAFALLSVFDGKV